MFGEPGLGPLKPEAIYHILPIENRLCLIRKLDLSRMQSAAEIRNIQRTRKPHQENS